MRSRILIILRTRSVSAVRPNWITGIVVLRLGRSSYRSIIGRDDRDYYFYKD